MKIKILSEILLFVLIVSTVTVKAQKNIIVKETFKVWGNCGMCKTTIEKSLKTTEGVKSAKWNVATKKMSVKFDSQKTTLDEIKKTIAHVGYDTEEYKASNEVYQKLHHCCQYERPKK